MYEPSISTRRQFLTRGLGIVGVGASLPNFLVRSALAGPDAESQDPVLVVVQLDGGNDGLATVIPYGDDAYLANRPTLGVADADLLKIDDYSAFSPALAPFKRMLDDGELAVVQAVGYPNGNKSHFKSMDIWHAADHRYGRVPQEENHGWLGRYCDTAFAGIIDSKLCMAIDTGKIPMAIRGRIHPGLALDDPRSFRFVAADGDLEKEKLYQDLNSPEAPSAAGPSPLDFITRTSSGANRASNQIMDLVRQSGTGAAYPDSKLGKALQMVSALIRGGLSTRVYYVSQGGYDTHAGQGPRHLQLMSEFGAATAAFQADMKAQGNAPRVLTMAFSEFGRRVKENGSSGTDHGKAGPMFLFGPMVKGGLHGASPDLGNLDEGDLAFKVDFRSVYATVLDRWMRAPSAKILGASHPHLDLLA